MTTATSENPGSPPALLRLLYVEDTSECQKLLTAALHDYAVDLACSLVEARDAINRNDYALILLDIELPDGTGLELLPEIYSRAQEIPVIMVTAKDDIAHKASAFTFGADDYVQKPFDPMEVRLRVQARLRKQRRRLSLMDRLEIGDLTCNLSEQRVYRRAGAEPEILPLTGLELKLLLLFARSAGQVFSRGMIVERVWGEGVNITDRTIDTHVAHLRKKLVGSTVKIETVFGSGYRLSLERVPVNGNPG